MKYCYVERKFSPGSARIIEQANEIIIDYQQQGFTLTLRQLYYQFVSRDLIPNKQTEYKRLGSIINDARLAGLIDWTAIEDRTRNLRTVPSWDGPSDIVRAAANSFKLDLWKDQENYCEVWIEKDALVGVIEPICQKLRVPFFACRGYTSQSEQWVSAMRLAKRTQRGKDVTIFHLGDHDPSGIDMTRDNEDRLRTFIAEHGAVDMFHVERLALNMDQVRKYRPPPNPAKVTDSRFEVYAATHGDKSWELDALDPKVISNLIKKHVDTLIDDEAWQHALAREEEGTIKLEEFATNMENE